VPDASRRAISRVLTMRWRGVSVTWPEGQADSQKPHSIHVSTMPCATGSGFRLCVCTLGSLLSTTPGLRRFSGSKSPLSSHIMSVAFLPHSSSTYGATLRPVPCSAFSEPSSSHTMWQR